MFSLSLKQSITQEIKQFRQLLNYCSYNTIVILDLDNTVFEPLDDLGSDQWYASVVEQTQALDLDKNELKTAIVTVNLAIQNHIDVKPVEPDTAKIIRALQDVGIPVFAVTSRDVKLIEPATRYLKQLGIAFTDKGEKQSCFLTSDQQVIFSQGVLFCSGKDKGECANLFFKHFNIKPNDVVMVDDRLYNLVSVKNLIAKQSGSFVGLRYSFLDEKVANVNMKKANEHLSEISQTFEEHEKEALVKLKLGI